MTRDELFTWVGGLGPHDLSLAVAIRELVRRAYDQGCADRGMWVASVREGYERTGPARVGSGFPMVPDQEGSAGRYLEEQVVARLEAAGMARREPLHEGWELIRINPEPGTRSGP